MDILFLGDSITDSGRDRNDPRDLGGGYPKYASAMLADSHPEAGLVFYNRGISGYHAFELLKSIENDLDGIDPAVVSVMIGINDVGHRHRHPDVIYPCSDAEFEENYRAVIGVIRQKAPQAKIVLMSPYLLDAPDKDDWREEVARIDGIVERLAGEIGADAYLPLHRLFDEALKTQPEARYYSEDGVHPNAEGACFIAEAYFRAVSPIVEMLTVNQ